MSTRDALRYKQMQNVLSTAGRPGRASADLLGKLLRLGAKLRAEIATLDDHAEDVLESQMRLLNFHCRVGRHNHIDIRENLHSSSPIARITHGVNAHALS